MRYERDFRNLQLAEDTVLTLGKFDGLHRGHELLMRKVFEKKKQGLHAAVFTFDVPPQGAARGMLTPVITTNAEKQQLFLERGVDYLIECPFTTEMMHMEAERFIEEIVTRLCVKCIVVGTDFHFGHNRRGDYRLLQQHAARLGYEVEVVEKMQYKGRDISSTFIREELKCGNLALAGELLGYPYFVQGTIVRGNRIGRTIGFPTVNIVLPPEKLLPPFGVYASRITLDGVCYGGITNIGKKPTIAGDNPVGAETFIYDFDKNVYGESARVELLQFQRPEKKFPDIAALKKQLQQDIADGRQFLTDRDGIGLL